ncbi:carboxylesterase 5A-like [Branchiostoma floridae]|uniref:Carboxylic ester hydrolase n=1 Tax=Branchiostoma floridae TaxID=7739 RepID=A0A9J7MSA0_BRAFL|nr:carboxylesterase 5A-like [Branchiostoma floridae]
MYRLLAPVALFLIVCAATAQEGDASEPTPAVSTLSGQVRGTVRSAPPISNKPVFTFLGIPFAAPPVGDLRFRPPEPVVPWEGLKDATEFGPSCPQELARVRRIYDFLPFALPHEIVSEDCLVLNIMTTSLDSSAALPVMVWIHGGSLVSGTGALYNFTALVAHQDVIVVTVNYRLGAFGFLSTGDDNAPGNYGFLDQVEALRWIKSNIKNFGGDPDRVTIFGESAGGLSVSYLVLSPLANGLFHRAISQSGTALTTPTTPNPLAAATVQAEEVGCGAQEVAAMMSCLRQKPFQDIVDSATQVARKMGAFGAAAFNPVVDGYFLLDPPMVALQKGEFSKVPYLLGVNDHEFGYLLPSLILPPFGNGMSQDVCAAIVKRVLSVATQAKDVDATVTALLEEYRDPNASDDPIAVQLMVTQILGDFVFLLPTVIVANNHAARGGSVYQYENQHRPGTSTKPGWVGCDHTDDLVIMTGMPYLGEDGPTYPSKPLLFSEEDRALSLDMMAYWANFARTGNPSDFTGSPSVRPNLTTWPSYTPDNQTYLKLAVASSAEVGLKANHVRIWYDNVFNQPTSDATKDITGKEEL